LETLSNPQPKAIKHAITRLNAKGSTKISGSRVGNKWRRNPGTHRNPGTRNAPYLIKLYNILRNSQVLGF
jgi:hypothetical protein